MAATGTGANQVPPGGVPRSWISNTRPDIANFADQYADQYGVPRQFVYNIIFRENGTGSGTGNEGLNIRRSSAGAEGPMQMIEATRRAYGITASSPLSAQIDAGVHYLSDLGWNRPDPQGNPTGAPGGQFAQFDPAAAAGGYIGSPFRYSQFVREGAAPGFKNESQAYVVHTTQGVVPMASLPQIFQDLPITQQYRGSSAFPTFDEAGWIAADPGWTTHTGVNFEDWHGDTGQPIGSGTGLPTETPGLGNAPLPYADTRLEGPNLQQWLNDPAGGQRVAGLSTQRGYDLPQGAIELLGRTGLTELGGGPEAFPAGNFPWFTPGRISEDVGAVLQHHALMPNNLVFDPDLMTWQVPNERRFPSNTGIWGGSQVAGILPGLGEGFQRDYLTHLGYGAPEHNQGGLSNTYWGAPNLYGAPSSGTLGNGWGTMGYGQLGMGNQGWGNINDMSMPQPTNYTQYFGALGNNNNWALANQLDPNVTNSGIWNPNFNQTFGAVGNPSASNANDYFATAGLPSGGFEGGGAPDPEGGLTASELSLVPPPSGGYGSPYGNQNSVIGNPAPPPAPGGWTYNNTGNLVPITQMPLPSPNPSPYVSNMSGPTMATGLEMY